MARYAIIVGGAVANVVAADSGFAAVLAAAHGGIAVESDEASPGDDYADGVFSRPAPVIPVPREVTRRQAKQTLLMAGLLDDVQPAIDAISDATQRGLIQIEWDDSQVFERDRPTLILLATALGLDGAGIDALFTAAAKL